MLAAFADALGRTAPVVAAGMGPGRSEDEIRIKCRAAALEPSRDLITWFTFWDRRPDQEARRRLPGLSLLPSYQPAPLDFCLAESTRERARAVGEMAFLRGVEVTVDDLWPDTWLWMFCDGLGSIFALDCERGDEPSAVRDCFREAYASSEWGERVSSLGVLVQNGTRWLESGMCRWDAEHDFWSPAEAAFDYAPDFNPDREPNPPL